MDTPMNDFDPDAHLILQTVDGQEVRADRTNTVLFTHLGNLAMYDHVFVQREENWGTYIFRHNPVFDGVRKYIQDNYFTLHLNMTVVAECDMQAFDNALSNAVPDGLPEEWEDGTL